MIQQMIACKIVPTGTWGGDAFQRINAGVCDGELRGETDGALKLYMR